MIELQQPTQPFSALDFSFVAVLGCRLRIHKVVSDALMISFQMVVRGILLEYMAKRPLAEEYYPVQTFGLDRQNESFGICVQIRRTRWQLHRFDIHRSKQAIEMITELAIPVVNQIPAVIVHEHAFFDIGDIAYDLCHPFPMRIRRDSRDVDLACAQMDEEKDVIRGQTVARPHFGGEEIGGYQYIHMASDELMPRCFFLPLCSRR